jgi:predicted nucleotidyltransferase
MQLSEESTKLQPPTMEALWKLEERTGASWQAIRQASIDAVAMRTKLNTGLVQFTSKDSSVVIVGSLARQEFTAASDVDWMLLVDGLSDPKYLDIVYQVNIEVARLTDTKIGVEGYFGTVVSSHDLVQHIGGQNDTNANTTRRMLLLLESISIGNADAHRRVLRNVLSRYLDEDRGLWYGSSPYKIPRFLFNDILRYWRTMAVDFAYKQRTRPGGDFALKNFKLRLSRKLIYLAGMIACFECELGFSTHEKRDAFYTPKQVQPVIDHVHGVLSKPPLEIVASVFLREPSLDLPARRFFDSYNEFLTMLSNGEIREQLKTLRLDQLEGPLAMQYRDVAHEYMEAIREIFLQPSNPLGKLTIEYGVF